VRGTTQDRFDPAHQLARAERFGEIVVGADFQADDPVDLSALAVIMIT
jgi:hypothetical protein